MKFNLIICVFGIISFLTQMLFCRYFLFILELELPKNFSTFLTEARYQNESLLDKFSEY